jgi:hypothetical protein
MLAKGGGVAIWAGFEGQGGLYRAHALPILSERWLCRVVQLFVVMGASVARWPRLEPRSHLATLCVWTIDRYYCYNQSKWQEDGLT